MAIPLLPFKYSLGGRPLHYTPKELAEKFVEFVEWCNANPFNSEQTKTTDTIRDEKTETTSTLLVRMVSVGSFLVFLGKTRRWWGELSNGKQGERFSVVKEAITEYCEEYQKEMAATGLLNANIISRLLGLADKRINEGDSQNLTIIVKSQEEKKKIDNLGDLDI